MKNKYQEALERLCKVKIYQKEGSAYDYLGKEIYKEEINILQELVDKETAMKVVKWELAQPETRCAKCGAGLERKHDYCWGCGRKVDWSDEDE